MYSCKDNTDNTTPTTSSSKKLSELSNDLVIEWNETFCNIERYSAAYRPGPAPRAAAYIGLATYEACLDGMPDYRSLQTKFSGLSIPKTTASVEYHWPTVYNTCYASLMRKFFPSDLINSIPTSAQSQVGNAVIAWSKIETTYNYYNTQYEKEVDATVFARSKTYAEAVADAVWNWSKSDQIGHEAYKRPTEGWVQGNNIGAWVPTVPGPGAGMFPYWGKVRRFALPDGELICKPPRYQFSEDRNSTFYAHAVTLYNLSRSLTYDDKWLAEFWSDDIFFQTFSPPSRWIAIADQIYKNTKCSMEKAVVTSAQVGLAINDAGVGAWNSKYYYNLERPESFIKRNIDPNYEPLLRNPISGETGITPSFPAYPSGHATFGAAGGSILIHAFGNNYAMTDNCHAGRAEFLGKPRSFNNIDEMIDENAFSRLQLGVHWDIDSEEGRRYGRTIAQHVLSLPWTK